MPVYVGVGPAGWPFFGAELIPGDELGDLGEDARGALARPLGEFLRALHAVTLDAELPEERMEMPELVSLARRRFAASTWAAPPVVFELARRGGRSPAAGAVGGRATATCTSATCWCVTAR